MDVHRGVRIGCLLAAAWGVCPAGPIALLSQDLSTTWAPTHEIHAPILCLLQADPQNKFTRVLPPPTGQGSPTFGASAAAITVQYTGFTPAAQTAFQYAVDIWQSQLTSGVPVRVNAEFRVLSGSTLGSAGATAIYRDFAGAPVPGTWFAKALANKLTGSDLDVSMVDITASFNSSFTWYYGTDGLTPPGQYDFVSVVLHELGHGLGFFGSMRVSGSSGNWGRSTGYPDIYDRFVENNGGQDLLNTAVFPNPSSALASALTSNALYWNGPNAMAANGGVRPRIYAPAAWQQGSSYSHLNEGTYPAGHPDSLMTYAIGAAEAIHDPGAIVRGMFTDEGWTLGDVPCLGVSLGASVSFPKPAGTPITWTAHATGCSEPEYRFLLYSGNTGTWSELRAWSSTNTAAWTPSQSGSYVVQAWTRQEGSTEVWEAWAWSGYFNITAPAGGSPCSGVSLGASSSFPVPAGTPITWTANATGCSSPEYQFLLYSGITSTWSVLRAWGSTNTAQWTPAQSGTYVVQAWARRAGSTAAYEAWAWSGYFDVSSPAGGSPCSSVSLGASLSFPRPVGTPITWTALATGCSMPEYRFLLYSGNTGLWSDLRAWSSINTAGWTPAQSGTYVVQAWTRRAGSTASWEAWAWSGYITITP